MRNASCRIVVVVLALAAQTARAVENAWDYTVLVNATVQTSPARITLSWPQDTVAVPDYYSVYRKSVGATAWGTGSVVPGSVTRFSDDNVAVGSIYEYQIFKTNSAYHSSGYGYIAVGINAAVVDHRGKLVLIVDNTFAVDLADGVEAAAAGPGGRRLDGATPRCGAQRSGCQGEEPDPG